jgi:signal peptidase I
VPETNTKSSVKGFFFGGNTAPSGRAKWTSELISLAIVLVAVIGARSSLADHYRVESGSMEYALMTYDRVVVNKMSYGFRIPLTTVDLFGSSTPERGDVALFDSPEDGRTRLIKRIVAIGGDRVSVKNGQLSINGQPLGDRQVEHFGDRDALLNLTSQPYLNEGGGPNFEGVVPHGMVLAIGDHRGNSNDGRMFGFVDERELLGRAVAIYYRRGEGFVWKPL